MARTVDDRVVAMSFENDKFESGVNSTVSSLDRLKRALNFSGAEKGLDSISASANRVDLSHIANSVDAIKNRFTGLGLVATAAMASIVNRAVGAGINVVKSFTLDPIIAGFHNYETQIGAVQTIMANTGLKGAAGLQKVNVVLQDLQKYANLTVYNFSDMAKNIGTFTAAGVDLKTSQESIKGIANLAALSGSNSDQASTAMYQLSQAIAAGRVKLQDWNSVVNAGLGGKVFQSALFNTANAMGTIKGAKLGETFDQWTAAGNSFRNSLQSGWVTSKVLTTTLAGFTGDMTTAQLKAKGYTADQIAHIKDIGKTAVNAATQIKTMSQLTQALKEEVATAWSSVFTTIFGNITKATTVFSAAHNFLENALTKPIYDLNRLLQGWSALGGRADALDAIKNAVKDFSDVLKPIREAWKDIFPATTAQTLFTITQHVDELTKKLKPSPQTVDELKRTFQGLFAVLDIGKTIIGDVFHVISSLFGALAGPAGGGFLSLTAHVGDFLVRLDQMIKKGSLLTAFFSGLSTILSDPARLFDEMRKAIEKLFGGFNSGGLSGALSDLGKKLPPLQQLTDGLRNAWDKFSASMHNSFQAVQPLLRGLENLFHSVLNFLTQSLQNLNFDQVLHAVDVGLLGGIFLLFKRFFGGAKLTDLVGGGVLGSVKEVFEGLTGSLGALQTKVKADAIRQIAIAVGILAAGMLALSFIPANKLNTALSGLTVAMGELVGAMALLNKIGSGTLGALRLGVLAGGLILLAGAVDLLVLALRGMSGLSWPELMKGLTGVAGLLFTLSRTVGAISANSAGMISAGLGIIAIATGVRILAGAVKEFGSLNLGQLAKGLGAVAVTLVTLGTTAKLFPTGMVGIGVGLLAVSAALKIIAGVVVRLGDLNTKQISQGLFGIASSLGVIALVMHSMPPNMIGTAAALVLVSVALKGISASVESFGGQSMDQIGKGLIGVAGSLAILAVALGAMTGALPGAAALVVASAALALLAPAMEILGHMSLEDIIKSMVAMAGAFTVLGIAGLVLEPVAPALLALGGALLAIGGGLALAGAGIALVGVGLSAIAVSGPIAVAAIVHTIVDFVTAIPKFVAGIVTALVSVVNAIAKTAPEFVVGLGKILDALLQAVIQATPKIVEAFTVLVHGALKAIRDNLPDLVKTGLDMLVALLKGIKDHIGEVVTQAAGIVTRFLDTLANKIPEIVAAGTHLLVKFLEGIANNIQKVVAAAADIVAHFITGVGNNLSKIVSAGVNLITKFYGAVFSGIGKFLNLGANALVKFLNGVASKLPHVVSAATNLIASFITNVAKGALRLVNVGAETVIKFINGVADSIHKHSKEMVDAGFHLAESILQGVEYGIKKLAHKIYELIPGPLRDAIDVAKSVLQIGSPSKVFESMGANMMEGLAQGVQNNAGLPVTAVQNATNGVVGSLQAIPDAISNMTDFTSPTITPVLDLSKVKAGARLIQGYIAPTTGIGIIGGAQIAPPADQTTAPTDTSAPTDSTPTPTPGIVFTQYNNSPAALSSIEIYRQTNNLLSKLGSSSHADVGQGILGGRRRKW